MKSWTDIASAGEPAGQLMSAIHGALAFYDWPHLARVCEGVVLDFAGAAKE